MPLFVLRNYEGVEASWHANSVESERAILQKRLRKFELSVGWEYAIALARNAALETKINERVSIWTR